MHMTAIENCSLNTKFGWVHWIQSNQSWAQMQTESHPPTQNIIKNDVNTLWEIKREWNYLPWYKHSSYISVVVSPFDSMDSFIFPWRYAKESKANRRQKDLIWLIWMLSKGTVELNKLEITDETFETHVTPSRLAQISGDPQPLNTWVRYW